VNESDSRAAVETNAAIEIVWRMEAPKLVAGLMRLVRDLGAAEDLAHDALVAALEQWPRDGVPRNPGAWLMAAARRRGIDQLRRRSMQARKHEGLARELDEAIRVGDAPDESAAADDIGDDLLRLMFIACHPVLPADARVALTLRLLGGLTTDEIARAFLVPEPTIAQRIVRAKKTLARKQVPFEVPAPAERMVRLASLLEVIYLVFNEGYAASTGDDWMRPALCDEAMRLGRTLTTLIPAEAEVHGLVALMELQASRFGARLGPTGEAILLLEQDRNRWDRLLITRGLAALDRAVALDGGGGFYALQAGIAACHARAATPAATDWARIAALYARLVDVTRSPIVRLNHAVAVGMAQGPAAGLVLVDALATDTSLRAYPYLTAARGDLLERLGRLDEARAAFTQAASLAGNTRDRDVLLARARGRATTSP
jgi:RNA polymerase sigma factor (sigma-70 family)